MKYMAGIVYSLAVFASSGHALSLDLTACGRGKLEVNPSTVIKTWSVQSPNPRSGEAFTRVWQTRSIKGGEEKPVVRDDIIADSGAPARRAADYTTYLVDNDGDGIADMIITAGSPSQPGSQITQVDTDKDAQHVFRTTLVFSANGKCAPDNSEWNTRPHISKIGD